jgi:hypothetical protein
MMKIVDSQWPNGRLVGANETGDVMASPPMQGRFHATRTTLQAFVGSASSRMQRFILSTFLLPWLAKESLFLYKNKVHAGISIRFTSENRASWQ